MTAIIDAEVVASTDIAVLPPDVETKVSELRPLDGEAQARRVTVMLSHARTGLVAAIAAQDLPGIVEFKAKASAIHEISKQLRLGKDMQLDAQEFVRRAERGLGVAIREGQANGTVETPSEGRGRGRRTHALADCKDKPKPTDMADASELSRSIYPVVDDVTDAEYEAALVAARAEANLSQANVVRKCKEQSSELDEEQGADEPAAPDVVVEPEPEPGPSDDELPEPTPAPTPEAMPMRRKRVRNKANRKPEPEPIAPIKTGKHHELKATPTELLENIEGMLDAIVQTCKYIDPAGVDPGRKAVLTRNVFEHLGSIRRSMKEIQNV